MNRIARRPSLIVLLLFASLTLACGGPGEPVASSEPVGPRVENPDLGVAIAALPEPFQVVSASGDTLELRAPGAGGEGRLVIAAGESSQFGINLVEAVQKRQAAFEAAPGGQYFGNRTLGGSLGNVFTARGSYETEDGVVEEVWAYALHPLESNRMLTVTYTYPPGESQERVGQLLALLGEIEGHALPDAAAP